MIERRKRLAARYAAAEQSVRQVEDRIRRVSEKRLMDLMKLSERERFEHLDDDRLALPDRAKLRQSIAVSLRSPKPQAPVWRGQALMRRTGNYLRRRLSITIAATIIVMPLGVLACMAWRNTGEVTVLQSPITVDWRLPTGEKLRGSIAVGYPLVIVSRSIGSSFARHWISGQGYATAPVNIERRF